MSIVYPSEEISRRWYGALERRLRQSPLDAFLTMHQMTPAPSGPARVSDNLSLATIFLVESISCGLDTTVVPEDSFEGALACAVSHGLAATIGEISEWRGAALASASHVLTRRWGREIALQLSAGAVHEYHTQYILKEVPGDLDAIRLAASRVLQLQVAGGSAPLVRSIPFDGSRPRVTASSIREFRP
jgi:hypothetical protein